MFSLEGHGRMCSQNICLSYRWMLRDRRLSARWHRVGTQVKQGRRPTQWATALRVAANRKTSCVPEMVSELQDSGCLAPWVQTRLSLVPLTSCLQRQPNGPTKLRDTLRYPSFLKAGIHVRHQTNQDNFESERRCYKHVLEQWAYTGTDPGKWGCGISALTVLGWKPWKGSCRYSSVLWSYR